jgi:hypothetical protein
MKADAMYRWTNFKHWGIADSQNEEMKVVEFF